MKTWQRLVLLILAASSVVLSIPAILKAMPSRYVARLPEPLQQLGLPETSAPILPTAAVAADLSLLAVIPSTIMPSVEIPPTFTPFAPPEVPTALPIAGETATPLPPTPTATPLPTPTSTPIPIPTTARLTPINHQFQEWNNCGPATLAMTLSYFKLNLSQKETAAVLKPNPEDRNVSPYEMAAYVNEQTSFQAIHRVNGNHNIIRRLVSNGIPVILEIGIEPPGEFRWLGWYGHYMLVVAYDDDQANYWVYDSWLGTSEEPLANAHPDGRILTYETVDTFWPHFNRNYIVVYTPEQATLVAEIIGDDMSDNDMWQASLIQAQADVQADPENPFFWFNLGTNYNALELYEAAAAAFDQARTIGLPWRMLWYQFGPYEAYYAIGRYNDVILLADVTLKDRPYFEESFYYKGLALQALGEVDEAQQQLERAAHFNPNFALATSALNQFN